MTSVPRTLLGFTIAVGFVAGAFLIGRHTRSEPVTVVALAPTRASALEPPTSPQLPRVNEVMRAEAEAVELRRKNRALERELQEARAAADSGQGLPPGSVTKPPSFRASAPGAGPDEPLPFPADAPEQYTPKGFEKVAHRAARECGMGLEVIAVDCSEFPCIAWTQATDGNVHRFSMESCSPWADAFTDGTVVVGAIQMGDGGSSVRYFSWMAVPPDPQDLLIAVKRAKERNAGMKEAFGLK